MASTALKEDDFWNGFGAPLEMGLQAQPRWYAFYTRARHEKQVERTLRRRSVDCFLPLLARERQWHDRKKRVEMPLFPSYVFARVGTGALHEVLGTPGVATVVRVDGRAVPIEDAEIDNVRRFVRALSGSDLEPVSRPMIERGSRIRIVSGPLQGVEGVVVDSRSRGRIVVGLAAIGQGMEVNVGVEVIEILEAE